MVSRNRSLFVIAVIAVVNALGYGIIIPLLYSYTRRFGLTDFESGLLFSVYSLFQFVSTPLIGRMSDAYGRKPLLLISLVGTACSFFLMAYAKAPLWLFAARALDGATAGNIPVALAVISDTTDLKNRAKGFGLIGAAFGFGFVFGPAISAATVSYGESVPFIIAGVIALVSFFLTFFLLEETNTKRGPMVSRHLFDFRHLFHALIDPTVGTTLGVSFLATTAWATYVYGFQPFSVKVLGLDPKGIAFIFTLLGVVGLLSQGFIIPKATRLFGERKTLVTALIASAILYGLLMTTSWYPLFVAYVLIQALANGFVNPLIQTLLSKETDEKSQGSIMGINASYQSIGQIIGPIIGGSVAVWSLSLPFGVAAVTVIFSLFLFLPLIRTHLKRISLN